MLMKKRKGDWMQTATGRQFWPLDPRADEVRINDVALQLAKICRFSGATREFYSVAQHSVLVSIEAERVAALTMPPRTARCCALAGLLHDVAEAYLNDVIRPLKRHEPLKTWYVAVERRVLIQVLHALGTTRDGDELTLDDCESDLVRCADDAVCAAEMRDLMAPPPAPWREFLGKPVACAVEAWSPDLAAYIFKQRYRALAACAP